MSTVMTASEFIKKAKSVAKDYKTLYVLGCFGAPLNSSAKTRYTSNNTYNASSERKKKINAATADTFGFDCVCLLKGLLWGWSGNKAATYGGAKYATNGVPDVNADQMFSSYCTNQSSDFKNIIPGEFVWMSGHIGVYIGDGLAIECTPIWADCVQITAVGNIGTKSGYKTRTWTKHGKSKFLDYSDVITSSTEKTNTTTTSSSQSKTTTSTKFKVGDKVIINGKLYASAEATTASGNISNKTTTITRVATGRKHPYNTTGDLGWMDESSIKLASSATTNNSSTLKVGDKVEIIAKGNSQASGAGTAANGIGYVRVIQKIHTGSLYPYQVGNNTGTTGFYKASALKK